MASQNKIIVISIPKSGTHLLVKCIKLLLRKKAGFRFIHDVQELTHKNNFYKTHLKYCKLNDMLLSDNFTKFFIYRDPRAQLVSYIFWSYSEANNSKIAEFLMEVFKDRKKYLGNGTNYWAYKDLNIDEFIHTLIFEGTHVYDGQGGLNFYREQNSNFETKGILEFYNNYLAWKNTKNICAIKFENLIGLKGGGSQELQLLEIKKIAQHLNIDIDEARIKKVAEKLFGKSKTFKTGQIHTWQKYFKPEHKDAFKKIAGQLLIDLGYEKDMNW